MFRRTLTVFLAVAFLVFALILGYAALGLSGPAATIEEAARALAADRPTRAIQLLDLAEGNLGPRDDQALLERILELRQRAYQDTANVPRALLDLRRLAELRPDDVKLALQRIPLLIRSGDAEAARDLAQRSLERHRDDPRLLELRGEAEQALYRDRIRKLVVDLGSSLDQLSARHALAGLRLWLYGALGDPVAERGRQRFEAVLRDVSPATLADPRLGAELNRIRELIHASQQSFRAALESEGEPVGAYAGLHFALREAGRIDDALWLGEIYLQRFDHRFTTLAAGNLAELHLESGRLDAVVELRRRYLPTGAWTARVEANRLDSEIQRLLLATMRAHFERQDREAMRELAAEAEAMHAHPALDLEPSILWIRGMQAMADKDNQLLGQSYNAYDRALAALPRSDDVVQKRLAAWQQRIQLARTQKWHDQFFEWALRTMRDLEEDPTRPLVELSRRMLARDDPESALFELRNARLLADYDEDVLAVRAEAVRAQRERAGAGVDFQIRRCRQLGENVPRGGVPDELLMPIAETALAQKEYEIAIGCADAASDAFPWARWPRRILIRAAQASGDRERALTEAAALLQFHPGDREALATAWEVREALGDDPVDLVPAMLLAGVDDPAVARTLLELARARGDTDLVGHLAAAILASHGKDAACLLRVAEVQADAGDLQAARATLQRALDLAPDIDQQTFRSAYTGYFLANAALDLEPAALRAILENCLALNVDDLPALVRISERLAELGRADLAYLVLLPVLQDSRHAAARRGVHFLAGARLALAVERLDRAEEHYVQAMGFDGSDEAAVELTLLLLGEDRVDEAREVFWERPAEDATSAVLAARFGRGKDALRWADRRHAAAPFDITALALRALLGKPEGQPQDLVAFAAAHRERLLATLTFAFQPRFGATAVREARALVADSQGNPHARVLLGTALASAGDTARALETLEKVLEESPLMITANDAAIRALEASGIDLATADDPRLNRLLRPELLQSDLATPRMLHVASQRLVTAMIAALRDRPEALDQLVAPWIANASSEQVNLRLVDLLLQFGRVDLALRLCESIEPFVPTAERQRFLATYLSLVGLSDDEALTKRAITKARNVLTNEAAYGVVVHFLLEQDRKQHGGRAPDPRTEPERTRMWEEMLGAHLELARSGGDRYVPMIEATVLDTDALRGRDAALDVIDSMLRADATMLPLWALRARWYVEAGRPDDALAGLRWIYRYIPTHPRVLEVVELAAREGRIGAVDHRMIHEVLDPATVASPAGRFAAGLLALREAQYDEAVRLLTDSEPQPDGGHLYYLGLAQLARGDATAAARALDQLRERHPDSPLGVNAAHFRAELKTR